MPLIRSSRSAGADLDRSSKAAPGEGAMRIPTGSKTRKYGFRLSGNLDHVRYDHRQRPTKLEIRCPKCDGRAVATDARYAQGHISTGDTSPHWRVPEFSVSCTGCAFRADRQSYDDLTEPFHQVAHNGETLWAWNFEHLCMIADLLKGRSAKGHPYEFYSTYIRRSWWKKRVVFSKLLTRHIAACRRNSSRN